MSRKYQPLIIIGAPRSGTNMLRNMLDLIPVIATWPCDEINYIWRHGNVACETDELKVEDIKPKTRRLVKESFDWVSRKYSSNFVLEKTCANTLRLNFVEELVDNALYLHIKREPFDVISSSKFRWRGKFDLEYILKKARFIPLIDLPYYSIKYLLNRIYKLYSSTGTLKSWGPRFKGIDQALKERSLIEVIAMQWKACNDKATEGLKSIENHRVLNISYEDLVLDTENELKKILLFLGINNIDESIFKQICKYPKDNSIGKGKNSLEQWEIKKINKIIGN